MIYTHKELLNKYKSNYQINKAVKNGELYKIDDLYSDKKNIHYLEILTKKYPNAIVTSDTAYYYHNLTDVIPRKICIATERNAVRIKDSRIDQSFVIEKYYKLGETKIEYEGVTIKIYSKERLLVNLVKDKNRTAYDYYKEIIGNYRKIRDELDVYKIEEYASVFPNGEKIMEMIQDEVF